MIWYIVLVLAFDLQSAISQVTKRENVLLSRKKRYLFFPPGANFVYQFVNVKALMKRVPKGMQWLNEWDVPFPLPSDPGEFREYRESHREERAVLNDFAVAFDSLPSDPGEFREYRESHREERAVLNDFAVAFDR
ncbi:hypothetical protein QE152_g817 [Popillia japonica]|uniref:Uncharacterized protein n=1 Tax=Popillia japonica TaxID=7064 RepID=A0AAW1NAI5_POPJA